MLSGSDSINMFCSKRLELKKDDFKESHHSPSLLCLQNNSLRESYIEDIPIGDVEVISLIPMLCSSVQRR